MASNYKLYEERAYWIPKRCGLRFVVVNQKGEVVNDANGYGYKTEAKCLAWIKMMQEQVGIDTTQGISPSQGTQPDIRFIPTGSLTQICNWINNNPQVIEPIDILEALKNGITLKPL